MKELVRNINLPLFATIACIGLAGCERNTYTTWSCENFEGIKIEMILKKAQMQFQNRGLTYCGSLGNKSYFDATCAVQIETSNVVFTPDDGSLTSDRKNYQCNAL